jgi:hypothetical protein
MSERLTTWPRASINRDNPSAYFLHFFAFGAGGNEIVVKRFRVALPMCGFRPKAEMPKLTTQHHHQYPSGRSPTEQLTDNTATDRWSERWQEWCEYDLAFGPERRILQSWKVADAELSPLDLAIVPNGMWS